jgi:DMSO reductase anchor subunit/ferredoxin
MDYDLCIGCASCAVACPYQARTIVHKEEFYYGEKTVQEEVVARKDRFGVAQKCTFCIDRVDDGLAAGLNPGVDPEATPACAASCITQAIQFGDFNDPDSIVSRLTRERDHFQMHAELGTDPQIKYLRESPIGGQASLSTEDTGDEAIASPLTGDRQKFWDMRAAMNFILGGIGSGTVVVAYLISLLTDLNDNSLINIFMMSGGIIAVGLFFVWLKIGRKLRAPFAILRPQSSWMSREIYAVGVFYLAVIADWLQPHNAWHLIVALSALAFLICQARILHAAKGIPTWRVPLMPWMLAATGLLEGLGLLSIVFARYADIMPKSNVLPLAGLLLVVVNAALWHRYISTAKTEGVGAIDRDILGRLTLKLHAIAHIVPLILFGAAIVMIVPPAWMADIAGTFAIAGGILWKAVVITHACHHQGFAITKPS